MFMWAKNKQPISTRGWVGRVGKIWNAMGIREQFILHTGRERQNLLKPKAMEKHFFKWKYNLERDDLSAFQI